MQRNVHNVGSLNNSSRPSANEAPPNPVLLDILHAACIYVCMYREYFLYGGVSVGFTFGKLDHRHFEFSGFVVQGPGILFQ